MRSANALLELPAVRIHMSAAVMCVGCNEEWCVQEAGTLAPETVVTALLISDLQAMPEKEQIPCVWPEAS